jgi:hypothetical protein
MLRLHIVVLYGVFLGVSTGCCNPGLIGSQPVTTAGQQTGMWCWAASGQMTMNFINSSSNVTQCDEANKRFGRTDCCNNPVPSACVQGGWPEYEKYSFTAKTTSDAPLSWDDLKEQIYCARKPFAFSWHWPGGGGHMMVAVGYITLNGTNYVVVNDPLPVGAGSQWVNTYEYYVGSSALGHTHWNDYYDITYKGGGQ